MDDPNLKNAVGPGLVEERQPTGHSSIEGFDDFKYVQIFNPMTVDFVGQVALTKPMTNAPMPIGGADDPQSTQITKSEHDIRNTYGFDLRSNAQATGKVHIRTKIPIKAGQSLRVFGSEAQVLVMQLVTAILQQEGHSNLADPALREATESRVILSTGNIRDQMSQLPQDQRQVLQQALDAMNDAPSANVTQGSTDDEPEFPDATPGLGSQGPEDRAASQLEASEPAKRVGRPPKQAR